MKKLLVFCTFLLICIIFTACSESFTLSFIVKIANHSQDTIGFSVYAHKINTKSDEVWCYISRNSIAPGDTCIANALHDGNDGSWEGFFKEEKIDTLYIYIAKVVSEERGQKCKLPEQDSNILKIYKYYDKNTDLTQMFQPTIVYPDDDSPSD